VIDQYVIRMICDYYKELHYLVDGHAGHIVKLYGTKVGVKSL
jgi:hypothetical protein